MKVNEKQLLILMDTCRFWIGYCDRKGVNRIMVPYPHSLDKVNKVMDEIASSGENAELLLNGR